MFLLLRRCFAMFCFCLSSCCMTSCSDDRHHLQILCFLTRCSVGISKRACAAWWPSWGRPSALPWHPGQQKQKSNLGGNSIDALPGENMPFTEGKACSLRMWKQMRNSFRPCMRSSFRCLQVDPSVWCNWASTPAMKPEPEYFQLRSVKLTDLAINLWACPSPQPCSPARAMLWFQGATWAYGQLLGSGYVTWLLVLLMQRANPRVVCNARWRQPWGFWDVREKEISTNKSWRRFRPKPMQDPLGLLVSLGVCSTWLFVALFSCLADRLVGRLVDWLEWSVVFLLCLLLFLCAAGAGALVAGADFVGQGPLLHSQLGRLITNPQDVSQINAISLNLESSTGRERSIEPTSNRATLTFASDLTKLLQDFNGSWECLCILALFNADLHLSPSFVTLFHRPELSFAPFRSQTMATQ